MKNITRVTLFSLVSASMAVNALANSAHHIATETTAQVSESTQQQIITTQGEVKNIDSAAGKITIAHEPIPALGWPAMTMRFTYQYPAMVAGIKEGNRVALRFIQQGNISQLTEISVTE